MSNTKLITQDYQNALEIWSGYRKDDTELSFIKYIEEKIVKIKHLKRPMYKCIKLPHANSIFEIGNLYSESYCIVGFTLSELPFHFELVVPKLEPEKFTWKEMVEILGHTTCYDYDSLALIDRIKTDHL